MYKRQNFVAAVQLGIKAHEQRVGEHPRLGFIKPQIFHAHARLLQHLAVDGLLDRLADLVEARHERVFFERPAAIAREQQPVTVVHLSLIHILPELYVAVTVLLPALEAYAVMAAVPLVSAAEEALRVTAEPLTENVTVPVALLLSLFFKTLAVSATESSISTVPVGDLVRVMV